MSFHFMSKSNGKNNVGSWNDELKPSTPLLSTNHKYELSIVCVNHYGDVLIICKDNGLQVNKESE